MGEEATDIHAAIDRARAAEREERDRSTRDDLDRVDRIGAALRSRSIVAPAGDRRL